MNKFNFVKSRSVFFILTAVIIIAGALSMILKGFNLDIDFVGGSELNYSLGVSVDKEAVEEIEAKVIEILGNDNFSSIRTAGKNNDQVIIRTKVLDNDDTENAQEVSEGEVLTGSQIREAVFNAVKELYPDAALVSADNVSAEVSDDLRRSAFISAVLAVVLMLVYIAIRFQISSAVASVICLIHDLFIMLSAYSLLEIPVNSTIIAALLTILGYSINATIIIFDRVRENNKIFGRTMGFDDKIDISIKQTFTRSLNTTITTLLTIGLVYILGVTSIKQFALPLIVGIVSGLYSSVCLAGSLWFVFKKKK